MVATFKQSQFDDIVIVHFSVHWTKQKMSCLPVTEFFYWEIVLKTIKNKTLNQFSTLVKCLPFV